MKTNVWRFVASWTLNGYSFCENKYFSDHCALKDYSAEHSADNDFNGSYSSDYTKLEIENEKEVDDD